MNRHLIVLGIAVLLICVGLSGCQEQRILTDEEKRFVGTWQSEEYDYNYLTFFSDGTGSVSGGSSSWELKDGKLVITILAGQLVVSHDYLFSDNNTKLTLTDVGTGISTVYIKQ